MIASLLTAAGWLDFAGALGLEQRSPFFENDSVPGLLSYPIAIEDTPTNRRLLGFPASRSRQMAKPPTVEVDLYFDGILYRHGVLTYQYFDKGKYNYRFEADADALGVRIDGLTVPNSQEAATATTDTSAPAATDDYVLAPVRNLGLYGDKNADWGGIINYHHTGAFVANSGGLITNAFVPFPFLLRILTRALASVGYTLAGSFIEDTEIQTLVCYNATTLDQASGTSPAGTVTLSRHVPTMKLAELLIALQKVFCLGYVVDTVKHTLTITPLREVVADPTVVDRTGRVRAAYRDSADVPDGFLLAYSLPSDDKELKSAAVTWAELKIGNGAEEIRADASTLPMANEDDPRSLGRFWLVPIADHQGRSAHTGWDLDKADLEQPLRLLFWRGMQPDSNGDDYPLVSSGNEDIAGAPIGNYTLYWDGEDGLYEKWHKPWLDFRANARQEERDVLLPAGELLTLNPARKELVDELIFLWSRVSISANGTPGAGVARVTYHQIDR